MLCHIGMDMGSGTGMKKLVRVRQKENLQVQRYRKYEYKKFYKNTKTMIDKSSNITTVKNN